MNPYTQLLIVELGIVLIFALIIFGLKYPTRFMYVFRGGEAAVPLALILLTINVIVVMEAPDLLSKPNTVFAALGSLSIMFVGLLLMARIIQILRHKARNLQQRKTFAKSLKRNGMDETEVDQLIRKPENRGRNEFRSNS